MPKAFNYEYSHITSTIGSSQMLLSMETPIPLTEILWVSCAIPERLRSVSFSLCYSERDRGSLPRYSNVTENRLIRLSPVLWSDILALDFLKKRSYRKMPIRGTVSGLTVEKLGYLEILRA